MGKRQGQEGKPKARRAQQRPAPEATVAPQQLTAPQAAVDLAGELPLLPLQSTVVFPGTLTSLQVWRDGALQLLAEYPADGTTVALVVQKDLESLDPGPEDLYQIGVAAKLVNRLNLPGNKVQVFLQGVARIKIERVTQAKPYFQAVVSPIVEPEPQGVRINALMGQTFARFEEMVNLSDRLPPELLNLLAINLEGPGRLADLIAYYLQFEVAEKQRILEAIDPQQRLELVMNLLNREIKLLQIQSDIEQKTSFDLEKSQREMYLRQQLEVIRRELGEEDPRGGDLRLIQERLAAVGLPEYAHKEADAELARLALLSPASSEYGVVRTYLEWLYELPWNQLSASTVDLAHARQVLDSEHEGLEQVKQRILEYLAVLKLKADLRGPILCLAGPPGVGKTSLGRSIARALGRQFVRLSVGGVRDEAEIRGHRRTYIGALPGRILQELRRAGTRNPVFMIDEVDKIGAGAQGDPAAALLEVLDLEQNRAFS
ncbi:MAG: LON peptidase substrate-binding domain-containing protein, partial [Deinococcus sp.]|nr:LON peptidase substrate-binding domain-containing protein [Deinococcus sp.]